MEEHIMYIYKTTNLITNKIYIGQHIAKINENKRYFGSGKLLKKSIKKHGIKNFKNEILEYCKDIDELNDREIFWISELNSTNLNIGYNITCGGKQFFPTEEFIRRCKEIRNNISNEKKNEWYSNISKTMIERGTSKGENNSMYGKEYTKERQEKCAKSKKENKENHKYYTEEYRNAMSVRNTGDNNPNFDNKWSDAQKENLSKYLLENEIHKGEKNSNFGKFGKESSGYKEIPVEISNKILYDYTNNFLCISKLSRKYNMTDRKIKQIIIENNLEVKIIYISKENEQKIKDMFLLKNMSFNKISKIIGIDYRNIKKLLDIK